MEFRGHSSPLSPGVLTTRATAPSGGLLTRVDGAGVHAEFEPVDGDEALIERRLTFVDDTTFEEVGTMSFGRGNSLRWRSVGLGMLVPSAGVGLRHGTVACVVDGGAGAFENASGRIVSNFLVADSGEITDRELGVIFVEEATKA
jgi:hypothetical protein